MRKKLTGYEKAKIAIAEEAKKRANPASWEVIDDSKVRHVWANANGEEITVDPGFYADSGTPIDEESGDDLTYVRTEILI